MLVGVLLQSGSIVCESVRLTLVQILLQVGRGGWDRRHGRGGEELRGQNNTCGTEDGGQRRGAYAPMRRQRHRCSPSPHGGCLSSHHLPAPYTPTLSCATLPSPTHLPNLQKRGIKMNPVSTLYHIAPCCFVFLFLPFTYIELPRIMNDPNVVINVPLLLGSAAIAFGEKGKGRDYRCGDLGPPGSVPKPIPMRPTPQCSSSPPPHSPHSTQHGRGPGDWQDPPPSPLPPLPLPSPPQLSTWPCSC